MSQSLSPSRDPLSQPFRPELLIGAASPLWAYFTGAAMLGVGWWWMNQWMRPGDLEGAAHAAAEPALEVLAEATGGSLAEALVSDQLPAFPVGGEAGPFGVAVLEAELIEHPELAAELAPEDPAPRKKKSAEGEAKPH